jgi:ABC-type transport system involved in cytochrome bd biosynthesis fused ATPase/permease subunit
VQQLLLFASTFALARALTDVFHAHWTLAITWVLGISVGRLLLGRVTELWTAGQGRTLQRNLWRQAHSLVARPADGTKKGPTTLSEAIRRASDVPQIEVLFGAALCAPIGLTLVGLASSWWAALIAGTLLAASVPLYIVAGKKAQMAQAHYDARRAVLEQRQLALLQHSVELRGLGAVTFASDEIFAISTAEHRSTMSAIKASLGSSLVTEFIGGVSVGLVAMLVGFSLLHGTMDFTRAAIAVLLSADTYGAIRRYGSAFHQAQDAQAAVNLLERPSLTLQRHGATLHVENLVVDGHPPVSFDLTPGDRLVVRGPSGSGKTTLLRAIVGWRAPQSGVVTVPEGPIAMVTPTTPLLSGTIRQNLDPESRLGDDVLRDTLKALALREERFMDLQSHLAADGEGVSSGERVRLTLARAMLTAPSLLLLDDISGLLDAEAKRAVFTALLEYPGIIIEASIDDHLFADRATIEVSR